MRCSYPADGNVPLIIFLSDNGASAEQLAWEQSGTLVKRNEITCPPLTRAGEHVRVGNAPDIVPGAEDTYASYGRAWANLSNTPFRLYKRWVHEGGIASPFVAHWPNGHLEEGLVDHSGGQLVDVLPSLLQAADIAIPTDLPGVSLLAVWRGQHTEDGGRGLFWEHIGNAAVRQGRWKLVHEYGQPWELYDLETDRGETHDLAPHNPALLAEMENAWRAWATDNGILPWEQVLDLYRQRGLEHRAAG